MAIVFVAMVHLFLLVFTQRYGDSSKFGWQISQLPNHAIRLTPSSYTLFHCFCCPVAPWRIPADTGKSSPRLGCLLTSFHVPGVRSFLLPSASRSRGSTLERRWCWVASALPREGGCRARLEAFSFTFPQSMLMLFTFIPFPYLEAYC